MVASSFRGVNKVLSSLRARIDQENVNRLEALCKQTWKTFTPSVVQDSVALIRQKFREGSKAYRLGQLQRRMRTAQAGQIEVLGNYTLRINHGGNFYAQCKDIFEGRIYHFESGRPNPFILDCGSNIGGVILYYKQIYPQARIVGFEPDPAIFPYLQENMLLNGLTDVSLLNAALSARGGSLTFYSDGKYGSCLGDKKPTDIANQHWKRYDVPCLRLRDFLTEPVDFLKMNIEGAEWEVLDDCNDHLRQVEQMVIEYHHWPGLPRTLHKILALLDRQGFEYLINHFDYDTNPGLRPPFRLMSNSRYYLLIYAKRMA
jgi:FkbM family methyltransferase